MKKLLYKDVRNYAPIDVTKGIDLVTKQVVLADAEAPDGYEPMPKCKFCRQYTPQDDYLGTCDASQNSPKFMAYGEMTSPMCEMYEPK